MTVAAALVAGALAGGWWLRRGSGEFKLDYSQVGYTFKAMEPGEAEFTLGSMHLEHPGKSIEVIGIESLRSPNVEYLGAFTVWPRDYPTNRLSVGKGYPAPQLKIRHPALNTVVPAVETAFVPPDRGKWDVAHAPPVVVHVGFRVVSGDVGVVNGVRVTYKVDGKKTHKDFRYYVVACIKPNPCEAPAGSEDDYDEIARERFGLLKRRG